MENDWRYIGNRGSTFYWVTNRGAPRLRIVATDIDGRSSERREIVAEDEATLDSATIVGDKLVVSYLSDARSMVRIFDLDGKPAGGIALPGIGYADSFRGEAGDPEGFYSFTSYNHPTAVYRYDSRTGETAAWAKPNVPFDPADFTVGQRFYRSRTGTRIPMFCSTSGPRPRRPARPALAIAASTSRNPSSRPAWPGFEQGSCSPVANLRGGRRIWLGLAVRGTARPKRTWFDDFIAAANI